LCWRWREDSPSLRRLQLRALHARFIAVQCRSSHGLHCGEADLHPKASRLSPPLSLSWFLSSTSLQSYHVLPPLPLWSPPPPPPPPPLLPPHPLQPLQERREGEECGWMWTTCRQSASKVFSRSFLKSLAADWVSITRIPALLSVAVWIREAGGEKQTMRNAIGLRYPAKGFSYIAW